MRFLLMGTLSGTPRGWTESKWLKEGIFRASLSAGSAAFQSATGALESPKVCDANLGPRAVGLQTPARALRSPPPDSGG